MIYRSLKTVSVVFSMLICLSVFAQGQGGPPRGEQGDMRGGGQRGGQQGRERPDAAQILEMLDANDDDKISKEEASKAKRGKLSEEFDDIDTNEDGFLVLEELETFFEKRKSKNVSPEKLIKKADKNDDGLLSKEELDSKRNRNLLKHFEAIDENEDGLLDLDELKVFLSKHKKNGPQGKNK